MQSPTAVPRMPASASGVSMQRSAPKRSRRPAVARKTPPARPTSSPMTSTVSSRPSSVCSASLTASTSVRSAIAHVPRRVDVDVVEEQRLGGWRLGFGGSNARAQLVLGRAPRLLGDLVGEHADAPEEPRVLPEALARTLLLDALGVDVRARV